MIDALTKRGNLGAGTEARREGGLCGETQEEDNLS